MTYTIDIPFIASFNFWDIATIVNTNAINETIINVESENSEDIIATLKL